MLRFPQHIEPLKKHKNLTKSPKASQCDLGILSHEQLAQEAIHCGLAMQWQSWRFPHDCQLHQDGVPPMMEQVNQENNHY